MKRVLIALLLLILATPAWGQDFEKGLQAYERGDYATALREFRPLAEQGDAGAQYRLGLMYALGDGVAEDHTEAARWYRKAAAQGDANAQVNLGVIYQDGRGVPQDYVEAARWYNKAAEQDDEGAEVYLKQVLRILTDLAQEALAVKDFASALRLLQPAAELGGAEAQTFLGLMHSDGVGTPQDYREAKKWLLRAAAQGDAGAQDALGTMYYFGRGVPQNYRQAKKWHLMAAEQGDAAAQSALGVMYYNGQGVPQDYVQAHVWFNLAAARYDPNFQKKSREVAVKNRERMAAAMTPGQIAEAQRLAREWWVKHGKK